MRQLGSNIAIGLHYRATDLSMPLLDFAKAAEARGFDSLYFAEHSHFPVERSLAYPGATPPADGTLISDPPLTIAAAPGFERYQRLLDPYIAMAFLASQVRMRLGTCVSLIAEHDAITLAKAIATLDHLSGGRIVLGVGRGWMREELEDHGFAFAEIGKVLREKVLAMKEIWTNDVASFQGDYVKLKPSYSWPKPRQKPHPPVLLGAKPSRKAFEDIAEWADGWLPMGVNLAASLPGHLAELRSRWGEAGRTGEPAIVVMHNPRDLAELTDTIAVYREIGVAEVLLDVPTDEASVMLPELDRLAKWLPNC